MATQSGAGSAEIDAARKRLAVAKKWEASARRQVEEAAREREEAEADLAAAEKKWEVICVDSEEENVPPAGKRQQKRSSDGGSAPPNNGPSGGDASRQSSSSPPRQPRLSRATHSQQLPPGQSRGDEVVLKYPFDGAVVSNLVNYVVGLRELGGHSLGVAGIRNSETTLNALRNGVAHALTNGESQIIIRRRDRERLRTGESLTIPLVDFWMRWISRADSQSSNSNVHFFPTAFMNTLVNEGPEAVRSEASNINLFDKKFLFLPVTDGLHWALCVVVNPGLVGNNFDDDASADDEHAFLLMLDCLKRFSKKEYTRHIRGWLNFEWKRRGKGRLNGSDTPFAESEHRVPQRGPKIPYQQVMGYNSSVFVCRYAYNLYLMRLKRFTWADVVEKPSFTSLITKGPAFQFDDSDIARIRGEFALLIDRLSATPVELVSI